MFGSETLEICIGLIFVYLLFSILATLIVEYVSAYVMQLRATNLKKIVERALDDINSEFSSRFYAHPLIKNYAKKNGGLPSYISSDKFAKVVLDIIRTGGDIQKLGKSSFLDNTEVSTAIDMAPFIGEERKGLLKSFAKEANDDINLFADKLEVWFNDTVERGQGWFNRKIKVVTLIVGFCIAIVFNLDSIRIYQQLSENSELREQIIESASAYLKDSETPATTTRKSEDQIDSAREALVQFYSEEIEKNQNLLSIGWDEKACDYFGTKCNFLLVFLGWIITALALSMGAPFWFDLLNKLVALRGASKPKEEMSHKKQVSENTAVG